MADYPPKRGVAYTFDFPVFDGAGAFVSGATFGTIQVSGDGGTAATASNTPVEIATSTGLYRLTLTASEMTADRVAVKIPVTSRPGVFTRIETVTRQLLDLATPAQVNAEVLDVLAVDTFAEASAVPAATSTLKDKINWLFLLARNKLSQTTTTQTVYADDTTTARATAAVSDDGAMASRNEWA